MVKGVNYASAGAGVIFSSGSELVRSSVLCRKDYKFIHLRLHLISNPVISLQGQRISFTQQIQQFTDTLQSFILSMGEADANELISNSVFYISIGVNDYIHYYLRNASNIQNLYLPWSFNQFVADSIRQEIKVTFLVFYFSYFVVFIMQERFLLLNKLSFLFYLSIIFSFNKSSELKIFSSHGVDFL